MTEQPDGPGDTARARAIREANLVTAGAVVVIAISFVLELIPLAAVIVWIGIGVLVVWALWALVLRDLYLDWQIDREINRPLDIKTSVVAGRLKNLGRRRLSERSPPKQDPPARQITLKKP